MGDKTRNKSTPTRTASRVKIVRDGSVIKAGGEFLDLESATIPGTEEMLRIVSDEFLAQEQDMLLLDEEMRNGKISPEIMEMARRDAEDTLMELAHFESMLSSAREDRRTSSVKLLNKNRENGGRGIQTRDADDQVKEIAQTFARLREQLDALPPEARQKLAELLRDAEGEVEKNSGSPGVRLVPQQSNVKTVKLTPAKSRTSGGPSAMFTAEEITRGDAKDAKRRLDELEKELKAMPRQKLMDALSTFANLNADSYGEGNYTFEDATGRLNHVGFRFREKQLNNSNLKEIVFAVQGNHRWYGDYGSGYTEATLELRDNDNPNNLSILKSNSVLSKDKRALNVILANLLRNIVDNDGKIEITR